jgi:hypothetical protein
VIATNVPKNENIITVPIFLKNGVFCILYPDSKIIGGSKTIMKRLTKCRDIFSMVSLMLIQLSINPANIPTMVVKPASYKYLCPDFLRKWPIDIAISIRKNMQRISVEMVISFSSFSGSSMSGTFSS